MVDFSKIQTRVYEQIQKQHVSLLEDTRLKLRYCKNVLRTPRLYDFYRSLLIQNQKKEVLKTYIEEQLSSKDELLKQFDSIFQDKKADKEALDALRTAAKISEGVNFDSILAKTNLKSPLSGLVTAQEIKDMDLYTIDKMNQLAFTNNSTTFQS